MKGSKLLVYALVILAIIATASAGLMDIMEKKVLTKEHLWNDGLFLLGIAILYYLTSAT